MNNVDICGKLEHRKAFPDCAKCAEKIARIAASFESSATRSHIKKKQDPSSHKRVQEVKIGDTVPYTDVVATDYDSFVERMRGSLGDEFIEDVRANPDHASDEETPYKRPLTPEGEIQLQAILETVEGLTDLQRDVFRLSHEGVWSEAEGKMVYTDQAIADALGKAQTTIATILSRIKAKVMCRYAKLKLEK